MTLPDAPDPPPKASHSTASPSAHEANFPAATSLHDDQSHGLDDPVLGGRHSWSPIPDLDFVPCSWQNLTEEAQPSGTRRRRAGASVEIESSAHAATMEVEGGGRKKAKGYGETACFDFDLNNPAVDFLGVGDSLIKETSMDEIELGLGVSLKEKGKKKQVMCIDDSDDNEQILDVKRNSGSGVERSFQGALDISLNIGMMEIGPSAGDGSRSRKRYTKEEKGKGLRRDSDWLSLATENREIAYAEINDDFHGAVGGGVYINDTPGVRNGQTNDYVMPDIDGFPPALDQSNLPDPALIAAREHAARRRHVRRMHREIAQHSASQLAHPQQVGETESQRVHQCEDAKSPFATALQKIIDHQEGKCKEKSLFSIDWMPSVEQDRKKITTRISSLLELSLDTLAKNAECIVSLDPVPDALKQKISEAACDYRKMDSHLLEIMVSESPPSEVCVKDCSWMTEEQFCHIFGKCETKHLTVLQLDLCGQALTENTLGRTLAKSTNCLPGLDILSLKSACRLTDTGLAAIVQSAPLLQSVNLSQCTLLTASGIDTLANCLGSTMKQLYIDDCHNIDALSIIPALKKFVHLEVLSVSGVHSVSDEFVSQFISARGSKMKELDLADCQKLTDSSIRVIGRTCPGLCALNLSNLDQLTDASLEYIANGCRSIQRLKFCRNKFSDEAIASFLEVSGQSLKELSLNHISKVGHYAAFSLAKSSKNLLSLDLSWCRKLTDTALGLIVDSCLVLRLLKLFGCTQITEVFWNGHSNSTVDIIGLNNMPVLKQLSPLDSH